MCDDDDDDVKWGIPFIKSKTGSDHHISESVKDLE